MALRSVVSDTSPLINLAGIGLLDLLPRLYGAVWIPIQVLHEYLIKIRTRDPDLRALPWLSIADPVLIDPMLPKLGTGEASAISLAETLSIRVVLLDEKKARSVAASRGLLPAGTLAVMLRAKNHGLIREIAPYIAAMQVQGRYLSASLIAQVLKEAGE